MMSFRVLISAPYMLAVIDRFRRRFERLGIALSLAEVRERLEEHELLPLVGDIDGTICGDDRFTARVLEVATPRLRVISKWGTGIDSIDLEAARRLGVRVCNTPGAFTNPVADSVLAYVLAFARRIPWATASMRDGEWAKLPSIALNEVTLGIVGVGRIGSAVARRARAFGVRLLGNDIAPIPPPLIQETGLLPTSLDDLLAQADFVSLNCDLNPTSRHLIGPAQLAKLKPRAVLINTARGPIVDERALISALVERRLGGVALDVFEDEPLPADSPLRKMDNALLAAHNSNSSPRAWELVHENTIRNLLEGLGITETPGL
jgi:D-3-phosphoglycerate dehydrogenase